MTKEELIAKELEYYSLKPEHIYHGTNAIPAALGRAMEEYAKQQAIAFVKYNCPDIKLEDSLLNAGYAGFLIHQSQEK